MRLNCVLEKTIVPMNHWDQNYLTEELLVEGWVSKILSAVGIGKAKPEQLLAKQGISPEEVPDKLKQTERDLAQKVSEINNITPKKKKLAEIIANALLATINKLVFPQRPDRHLGEDIYDDDIGDKVGKAVVLHGSTNIMLSVVLIIINALAGGLIPWISIPFGTLIASLLLHKAVIKPAAVGMD